MSKSRKSAMPRTEPPTPPLDQIANTGFLLYEAEDGYTQVKCRFVSDSQCRSELFIAGRKGGRDAA